MIMRNKHDDRNDCIVIGETNFLHARGGVRLAATIYPYSRKGNCSNARSPRVAELLPKAPFHLLLSTRAKIKISK